MSKKPLKENSFDGAPGGAAGTLNYGTGYGTPSSPNVSQDPSKFPDGSGVHKLPAKGTMADSGSAALAKDVDALMTRKDVPTIDDVAAGMDYELSTMIVKDKKLAKQEVIKNLKKNPHFYSDLDQLDINMDKTPQEIEKEKQLAERRKIFEDLITNKPKRETTPELNEVMRDLWNKKQARRNWMSEEDQ